MYRSSAHIYAQVIDDAQGHTLLAASSRTEIVDRAGEGANKTARAKVVGEVIAERAKAAGITLVVFDRGGFLLSWPRPARSPMERARAGSSSRPFNDAAVSDGSKAGQ